MTNTKKLWCLIFLGILSSVSAIEVKVPGPKCSTEDFKCLGGIAKYILKLLAVGVKELNVEAIDPIKHALIEGHISDLKYTLTDSVVIGFKDIIVNFLTAVKGKSMHFDFTVPYFEMRGQLKASGKLLNVPVNQEGSYFFNATNIHMVVDMKKEFIEKGGKTYLKLTNRKASTELLGSVYLSLQSPNGESNTLPVDLQKLINENPKELAQLWQAKISFANMEKIFDEYNKVLAVLPLTDYIEGDIY